jgi:AcrR family transcriptional regulator
VDGAFASDLGKDEKLARISPGIEARHGLFASPGGGTRREEILATAARMFASSGLKVSLQEIAEACGILAGSLYHHFASKEAIVAELIAAYRADLEALADDARASLDSPQRSDLERIVQFAEAIVGCATRHPAALLQTLYMAPSDKDPRGSLSTPFAPDVIVQAMNAILHAARENGYIRPDTNPEMLASQLCESMFNSGLGTYHLKPEGTEVPRTKCQMLLQGIAIAPPGDAALDASPAFEIAQNVIENWETQEGDLQLARLQQAARREFGRNSFEAATVRDIAEAANMSTSAIYRLAGSKDNLLASIMKPFVKHVSESWDELMESSSSNVEKLDALIWVNINLLDRFSEEFRIQIAWLRNAPPQPWADFSGFAKRLCQLKSLLKAGEQEGTFRQPGSSLDIRAHCLLELSWMPRTMMLARGRPAALAQARATLIRGAAAKVG